MSARKALRRAAALAAMGCAAGAFAAGEPCVEVSPLTPPAPGDGLEVSREGAACVVTVTHGRGIGAARIVATAACDALVLRFAGFAELESLALSSSRGLLLCELERGEAAQVRRCRLDGDVVHDGPARAAGGLEFRVPARLVPGQGAALDVRWVDYWR